MFYPLRGFLFFFDTRGDPLPSSIPHRYDVILAADCVYFEPAFPLLVKTLTDLVPDKSVEVLFCYKKRRKVRANHLKSTRFAERVLSRRTNVSSPN